MSFHSDLNTTELKLLLRMLARQIYLFLNSLKDLIKSVKNNKFKETDINIIMI